MRSARPARIPDDWSADPLAAADDDEIGPSPHELGQPHAGREVGRHVDQNGDASLPSDGDLLAHRHDFRPGSRRPVHGGGGREHGLSFGGREGGDHRGALRELCPEVLPRFRLDDRHPGVPVGAVVAEPVRRLDQTLPPRPVGAGKGVDPLGVRAGQATGGPEHHGREAARGDQRRLGPEPLGDPRPRRLQQLVHVDEELVRLGHGRDDLGVHAAAAEPGDVLVRRQMRSDAEEARVDVVAVAFGEGARVGRPALRTRLSLASPAGPAPREADREPGRTGPRPDHEAAAVDGHDRVVEAGGGGRVTTASPPPRSGRGLPTRLRRTSDCSADRRAGCRSRRTPRRASA